MKKVARAALFAGALVGLTAVPAASAAPTKTVKGADAGYLARFPGQGTVRVTVVVPEVTPVFATSEVDALVAFDGAQSTGANLVYDSSDNRVLDRAQAGSGPVMTIQPGETLLIVLKETGTSWSVRISDASTGNSISSGGSLSRPTSVVVGMQRFEPPEMELPIPPFDTQAFSAASLDGRPLAEAPGLTTLAMTDDAGARMVRTGSLTAGGSAFALTYLRPGP